MPPLRPPGVGEPTVPMTRSASAERVFRFRCRGFDTPPDPLLSAPSVPLLRARPSFASCPSILVQPMPARRRLSLRCPCQFVPRCPCQFVPRCPCTSIPAQPVATHSLLPVPVGPRTARRLSTCFRCGGFSSGGSGMTVAASTCRSELYIYRCGRNRCRNRRRSGSPIGEERGAADRRLRGVSFPNGRSFLPETIFLR